MRKFLIATHGSFAAGIKSSLEMIAGSIGNIEIIQAYTEANKPINEEFEAVLAGIGTGDELIVFTDLAGGSITSQVAQLARRKNIFIVAGVNLPLVLELVLADPEQPAEEIIEAAISSARDQIVFVSKLLNQGDQV
jgi:fructoselysine and glucoselysine-specific PTS system IIA component